MHGRSYQRGPLSLVRTAEELLERKCSSSGLETENMAVGICHAGHVTPLYPQEDLTLISPTSGGHFVGIVRSRTQAMDTFQCSQHLSLLKSLKSLKPLHVSA
jgi:hypothetical protein